MHLRTPSDAASLQDPYAGEESLLHPATVAKGIERMMALRPSLKDDMGLSSL